jgi:hypothetical protein
LVVLVRSRRGIEDKLSGVGGDSGNDKHEGTYHDLLLREKLAHRWEFCTCWETAQEPNVLSSDGVTPSP